MQLLRTCTIAVLCLFPTTSNRVLADDKGNQLQGTWTFLSAERDGKAESQETIAKFELQITVKQVIFKVDGKVVEEADYTIDTSNKPYTMDVTQTLGPMKGKKALGIYKFEKTQLTFCFSDPDKQRPSKFGTAADSGTEMIVVKRK